MKKQLKIVEEQNKKKELPDIHPGDSVKVSVKIKEGEKERIQPFEGTIIKISGCGIRRNFTVRRITMGVGIERVFPLHSPIITDVEIKSKGHVRRAKLYYLRGRSAKKSRIAEKKVSK